MTCDFAYHNETSVRCSKCGRVVNTPFAAQPDRVRAVCRGAKEKPPQPKSRGLGDTVAKITTATGIKSAVETLSNLTGLPCGCKERQKKLNELFPYG